MLPQISCLAKYPRAIERLSVSAFFLLLFPLAALAQTNAGLNGIVTDASGAVVQGVRVAVTSVETGLRHAVITNDSGLYEFPLLQPGAYNLTAQKEGFKQITQEGIR